MQIVLLSERVDTLDTISKEIQSAIYEKHDIVYVGVN